MTLLAIYFIVGAILGPIMFFSYRAAEKKDRLYKESIGMHVPPKHESKLVNFIVLVLLSAFWFLIIVWAILIKKKD